eukprot:scaffold10056_cov69-Phaeocystis_antarctica.AAC.5
MLPLTLSVSTTVSVEGDGGGEGEDEGGGGDGQHAWASGSSWRTTPAVHEHVGMSRASGSLRLAGSSLVHEEEEGHQPHSSFARQSQRSPKSQALGPSPNSMQVSSCLRAPNGFQLQSTVNSMQPAKPPLASSRSLMWKHGCVQPRASRPRPVRQVGLLVFASVPSPSSSGSDTVPAAVVMFTTSEMSLVQTLAEPCTQMSGREKGSSRQSRISTVSTWSSGGGAAVTRNANAASIV